MDLRSDPAQRQFRQYLRKSLRAHDRPELAAEVVDIGLPAAAGGLELGEGGLAIAFEELGAALLPNTLLGTLVTAECALAADDAALHRAPLSGIRDGRVTVALPDLDGTGYPVGDTAWIEPDAEPTHVLAGVGEAAGQPALALVPAARAGLHTPRSQEPPPHFDTAPRRVLVDRSAVTGSDVLIEPERAAQVWPPVLCRARLRQAAYLTGLASAAWELTAQHVRTRRQFGSALAENQAVAFPMAELAARSQACQLAVHHAAWAHDTGRGATDLTSEALCLAAELALDTTRLGMHLHGALGLLLASPVQRCYRRAAVEAGRLGHIRELWRRLGHRRLAGLWR